MNESILERFRSKVTLKISGKNVERLIQKLYKHKIEILKLSYSNYKTVIITIYEKDYQALMDLKTIYEIDLVGTAGMIKIKRKIRTSRIFLLMIILGFLALYFLSHVIFKIEIIHTNKELRNLLIRELENRGIHELSIKKSFQQLEKIKEDITETNRDKIEWLSIEAVGTKYVVRVEMRKLEEIKQTNDKRNVVAKKSAILRNVEATKGEIVKNTNDYVKTGDIVISGDLRLNEEIKDTVSADGKIYGEVWYKVTVTYPFVYQETTLTGKEQTAYTLQLLNHNIQLYPWDIYRSKKVQKSKLLSHPFLPFAFYKEKQQETIEIDEINTEDEAISKAETMARKKMKSQLSDKEKIISQKNLKVEVKKSKIELEVFFTVLEDITSYQNIVEENIESE